MLASMVKFSDTFYDNFIQAKSITRLLLVVTVMDQAALRNARAELAGEQITYVEVTVWT